MRIIVNRLLCLSLSMIALTFMPISFANTNIIFDNDAAIDDIIAFIYLANLPQINIKAITIAATGEAHGPQGAKNIANLSFMLGKPDIPIAYGKETSQDNYATPYPNFIRHAMDNIFKEMNIPKHPYPPITYSTVTLIKQVLEKSDEKITILETGPLTNIAEFIIQYPHLKNKIEKIVVMGGAVHVKGNINALDKASTNKLAEWNIYADPKAAETVFTANIPIILVPLDATNQVPMTKEFYDALSKQTHPSLKLIYQLLTSVIDQFGMDAFLNEFYLWDPLAAMICADPTIAITENTLIHIDLATAQTKPTDKNEGAPIQVTTKLRHADSLLMRLIADIQTSKQNIRVALKKPAKHTQAISKHSA